MALIKVNSWSQLPPSGGFYLSPVDILLNTEDIIGAETRVSPYNTTGITTILYLATDNEDKSVVEVVVTDSVSSLEGLNLSLIDSFTSFNGVIRQVTSSVLLNTDYVTNIETLKTPYLSTGITVVASTVPINNGFYQYRFIVSNTLDSLVSSSGGGGGDIPLGTDRQVLGYVDGSPEAVTLGWKQFSDLPTPPTFLNGVLTGTAFNESGGALFAFVELDVNSIAVPSSIPFYKASGRLTVGNASAAGDAVNLGQIPDVLKAISGYNSSATQTLQHVSGVLQWVTTP